MHPFAEPVAIASPSASTGLSVRLLRKKTGSSPALTICEGAMHGLPLLPGGQGASTEGNVTGYHAIYGRAAGTKQASRKCLQFAAERRGKAICIRFIFPRFDLPKETGEINLIDARNAAAVRHVDD